MEFLRFGSSIPGSSWGCCACCIIQDFNNHPDDLASIQIVGGDSGTPITNIEGNNLFSGKTYREIFWQRLRYGTFGRTDMPNHVFFAILTDEQISSDFGIEWLPILKEAGFEFIRTADNSVYTGSKIDRDREFIRSPHPNHIFGLFRNIGEGSIKNPFKPPREWTRLGEGSPSVLDKIPLENLEELSSDITEWQIKAWDNLPEKIFYTQSELEKENIPITLAGRRSKYPQELKSLRDTKEKGKVKEEVPWL